MARLFRRLEWSRDHDYQLGPFLYARERGTGRTFAAVLCSGDDEYRGCTLRLTISTHTLLIGLPPVLQPAREVVPFTAQLGSYIKTWRREIGLTLNQGHLSMLYGRQTHDSRTNKQRGWFLPWTQWRHVRISFYGRDGEHFATVSDAAGWQAQRDARDACPTRRFAFCDYDGEALTATTRIEEREWLFGTGRFKWLSVFRQPKIKRSLDITFSGETGRRKGSWKGGTIAHSIEMLPGEPHEAAFRRYCMQNRMTFGSALATEPAHA